jgi:hypothetical protein
MAITLNRKRVLSPKPRRMHQIPSPLQSQILFLPPPSSQAVHQRKKKRKKEKKRPSLGCQQLREPKDPRH